MFPQVNLLLQRLAPVVDEGVHNAGDGEDAAHDGADGGEEVGECLLALLEPHLDRVNVLEHKHARQIAARQDIHTPAWARW